MKQFVKSSCMIASAEGCDVHWVHVPPCQYLSGTQLLRGVRRMRSGASETAVGVDAGGRCILRGTLLGRLMESKPSYKLSAPAESFRPTLIGRNYAVSCGHYLAAAAAARVLDRGGNAVDAGVTAAMALAVLQPDIVSIAGVAPTLVYDASSRKVTSLAGLGYWPAANILLLYSCFI